MRKNNISIITYNAQKRYRQIFLEICFLHGNIITVTRNEVRNGAPVTW